MIIDLVLFLILSAGVIVLSFLDLVFLCKNISCHACKCNCVDSFLPGSLIFLHAWGKLFDSLNTGPVVYLWIFFSLFAKIWFFVTRYIYFVYLWRNSVFLKTFKKIKWKKNCWILCLLVKAEVFFFKLTRLMG